MALPLVSPQHCPGRGFAVGPAGRRGALVSPGLGPRGRLNGASLDVELPCGLCVSQALTLVMASAHLESQGFC